MTNLYIQELLDRWFRDDLSPEETEILSRWILEQEDPQLLESLISKTWDHFEAGESLDKTRSARILQEVLSGKREEPGKPDEPRVAPIRTRATIIHGYRWAAVAATALLLLGGYLFYKTASVPGIRPAPQALLTGDNKDVKAPARNLASIRLANGQYVLLDSLEKGRNVDQGGVALVKTGRDEIRYSSNGESSPNAFNTLYNPRGSRVASIVLGDGTRVFLNAGSSLEYPVAFSGGERVVELTGEGFFEVAPDHLKPFKVIDKPHQLAVHVLGTRFNVKAYEDENVARVTLIDGAVNVDDGKTTRKLIPGQQAAMRIGGDMRIIGDADLDEAQAWKNGQFYFNKLEVPEIMREISRWYGIDVKYEGSASRKHFSGIIGRERNVSEVLEIFSQAGIRYRIEENVIVVVF